MPAQPDGLIHVVSLRQRMSANAAAVSHFHRAIRALAIIWKVRRQSGFYQDLFSMQSVYSTFRYKRSTTCGR
ncbi:MAG TPA: hypothetical protein VIJ38_06075 [Acidobacteriaceae bacterium]